MDMDLLDPGVYDAKLARTSSVWESDSVDPYENVEFKSIIRTTGSAMDMDLLDPGVYDAKLARTSSVWESDGVDPYENVEFKSVTKTAGHGFDLDLLDPGIYEAKLVRTSNAIKGLQEDNLSKGAVIASTLPHPAPRERVLPRPRTHQSRPSYAGRTGLFCSIA